MTERQRRQRRRIRRFAPTVVFLVGMTVIVFMICTLTAPPTQSPKAAITQMASTITQTPSTETKPTPLHTETVDWVTEKPETITPEAAEETQPEEISRYAELDLSDMDIEILAALVYHEARGECFDGQIAVIEVVLNRCLSPEFPNTVEEVVFQRYGEIWQFSPAPYLWTAEPTQTQYNAVYTAIDSTDYILPAEAVFFSTTAYNDNIVAVIGNHTFCAIREVQP